MRETIENDTLILEQDIWCCISYNDRKDKYIKTHRHRDTIYSPSLNYTSLSNAE